MEFRYYSQSTSLTSVTRDKIRSALQEFHECKDAIIEFGLRRGPTTNAILKHWHIPKFELMQNVIPSIEQVGSLLQWSADTMEHAHIEVIKDPASTTNNHNYEAQICRCLDHDEKCRIFDTVVALSAAMPPPDHEGTDDDNEADEHGKECEDTRRALLQDIWVPKRNPTNFFSVAGRLLSSATPIPVPTHTFIAGSTAIHFNYDQSLKSIPVDKVAEIFGLPDLHAALANYVHCELADPQVPHTFGQRKSLLDTYLPFQALHVWYKVCLQQKVYHNPSTVTPTFTVHTHPPDPRRSLNYGWYDAAIMNINNQFKWPTSGLQGRWLSMLPLPVLTCNRSCCRQCPSFNGSSCTKRKWGHWRIFQPFFDVCKSL